MGDSVPSKKIKSPLDLYNQLKRISKDHSVYTMSDNVDINLFCIKPHLEKKIAHLPQEEQEAIKLKHRRFIAIKGKLSSTKRILDKQNIDINQNLLEVKKAEILELFGAYYNIEEIHKKLIEDTGVPIELATLRKFHSRYRLEIEKLQLDYDKNIGTIGITKKRSRLEQIDYMIRRLKQEFDSTSGKSLISYSKSIKELLEQARKEVEGNQLFLNVDGTININATVENTKSIESLYADLNFNQLIIAMMAQQQKVNPLLVHYKMLNSYYAKHTGFNQQEFDMDEEIQYPSKLITGWDEVKDKVKRKEIETKTINEKFDKYIEDYFEKDGTSTLRTELTEKVKEGRLAIETAKKRIKTPNKDVQAIIAKIKEKNKVKNTK
jgi:hypothetical protein